MRIVYAGNTLSPRLLNNVLDQLEGHDYVIDCIAKNFETLEPGSSFRLLRQDLVKRYGKEGAAARIICTGTIGSPLEDLAYEQGYTFMPFATNVGGRFTALTAVHLLPMAAAGIDIRALVEGARKMSVHCRTASAQENLSMRYASIRKLLWDAGYRIELLSFFEPTLRWFSKWWEQLFAESEGKDGKGIFPTPAMYSEELHSIGQFVQEGTHILFETFFDVTEKDEKDSLVLGGTDVEDGFSYLDGMDFWDINRTAFTATRAAHAETLPCLTLTIDRIDEENYGMLFYMMFYACYISCTLLGICPFDQEGVEVYKRRMFKALGKPGA